MTTSTIIDLTSAIASLRKSSHDLEVAFDNADRAITNSVCFDCGKENAYCRCSEQTACSRCGEYFCDCYDPNCTGCTEGCDGCEPNTQKYISLKPMACECGAACDCGVEDDEYQNGFDASYDDEDACPFCNDPIARDLSICTCHPF